MIPEFIVIDDDAINNILCRIIIKQNFPGAVVHEFTDPELALSFINENYSKENAPNALAFLDINMPKVTGWEFLDEFRVYDDNIKNRLKIFILSSSFDPLDLNRAANDELVADYIEKPFTKELLQVILMTLDFIPSKETKAE